MLQVLQSLIHQDIKEEGQVAFVPEVEARFVRPTFVKYDSSTNHAKKKKKAKNKDKLAFLLGSWEHLFCSFRCLTGV